MDLICDMCGKSFFNKRARNRHRVNVHPFAEPVYKCIEADCNACFTFPRELTIHVKSAHCNGYVCCKNDFKKITDWKSHRLRCHASYDDKLTHSILKSNGENGENFLKKIYFVIHVSGEYFKIGKTKKPISRKLAELKADRDEEMVICKSWNLSKKFEHEAQVTTLEKELHAHMLQFGFVQKGERREYFYFRNKELEEKWIQDFIQTTIEQHEAKDALIMLAPVVVECVKRPAKRKYKKITEPTERQLKERERFKKYRQTNKGKWLYCATNGNGIVKVGHTSQRPVERLGDFSRRASNYGRFTLIKAFTLGDGFEIQTYREYLEKQVIEQMHTHFRLIAGTEEHFECSIADHGTVIEIIENVIAQRMYRILPLSATILRSTSEDCHQLG